MATNITIDLLVTVITLTAKNTNVPMVTFSTSVTEVIGCYFCGKPSEVFRSANIHYPILFPNLISQPNTRSGPLAFCKSRPRA
jgi:hypothetical protein